MEKLVKVTYDDFKRLQTIEPEQFDQNFDDVVAKIDEVIDNHNDMLQGSNL